MRVRCRRWQLMCGPHGHGLVSLTFCRAPVTSQCAWDVPSHALASHIHSAFINSHV